MYRSLLLATALLAALPVSPALAQPDWEAVDLGTEADLLALSRGGLPWAVGTGGFVASVASDYATWTVRDIGTTEDLLSVIGPGSSSRYIAGRNGTYRYTQDGGTTWQSADFPDTTQEYVAARPNSTFFGLGSGGALYADPIGNPVAWIDRMSGATAALRAAESTSVLMAFGDDGTMLQAETIVGENWTPVASGTTADLNAVAVQGTSNWLVVGEGGLVLKSTDNGQTWTPRASGTTATLYALDGLSGTRYLAVGEGGTLLETRDFGETWCAHALPTTATLRTVAVPLPDQWFVAGDGGVMLRSQTQGGGNCTPVSAEAGPEAGYRLSAAWPNPATGDAALSLSVDRPQHITAVVYDRLGRRVGMVFDGWVASGVPQNLIVERLGVEASTYVVRVVGETFAASRSVTFVR